MRALVSALSIALAASGVTFSLAGHAADVPGLQAALEKAMASETRSESDKARDKNRKPIETLKFFGLQEDMRVVELLPGGGWYTSLLAPVLRDRGELFVALGTDGVESRLLGKEGFDKVEVLAKNTKMERRDGRYHVEGLDLGVKRVDLVLTFRNMHNFDASSRARINDAVFTALKRGGLYGVVDHTRRHMQKDGPENGRRMDPVLAIKEIEAAGFEFVDYSDLHYRLDDELRYEVGRRSVAGNTDRFTL
ncbi:MAG: methyltransferase, partial [Congregibacter sp.]|nr:methyltransferase [Congregibacter sp.]